MCAKRTLYETSGEGDSRLQLNSFTLQFKPELEQEYRKYHFDVTLVLTRLAYITGFLYYASFFLLDLIAVKEYFSTLSIIRFGIVCPTILIIFVHSYSKGFRKYYHIATFFLVIVAGFGVIAMTILVPDIGRQDYYVGVILVLIFCYILTRLKLAYAAIAGWTLTLSYIASIAIFPGVDITISSVNIFFLVSANLVGLFGAYSIEYYMRKRFSVLYLLNEEKKKVAIANSELEAKVIEKTAELQAELIERKEVAEELLTAKEKAEESDKLKTAFLTNMSHEIRTPMNGILGFSNLLKSRNITPDKQSMYIDMIEKSGDRMLNTLNDLINISKIEAGLMTMVSDIEDVNQILSDQYTFFVNEATNKGLEFLYKPANENESLKIITDKEKFISIITNLLKNAIKFTDSGFIEFGYQLREGSTEKELEFYVIDSGKGIPEDRQHNIFDRFVQAETEYNRASEGFGLGLSIARAYTEMLGGRIWLNTEYKKGAEFRYRLPLRSASKDELL